MPLQHFEDLLSAARDEPRPQRLLLVFTAKELPDDATAGQRASFEGGAAGVLAPVFYVDKPVSGLQTFDALCAEAGLMEKVWDIVFIGAIDDHYDDSSRTHAAPTELERMLDDVKSGRIAPYLAADRAGYFVRLQVGTSSPTQPFSGSGY